MAKALKYYNLTRFADSERLPLAPTAFYLILSFEILLRSGDDYILPLVHSSYNTDSFSDYEPGILAFPFTASDLASRALNRIATVGELRLQYLEAQRQAPLRELADSYLYQMGLISYDITPKPPIIAETILELKESSRDPGQFKCYNILRYSVTTSGARNIINLLDPYCYSNLKYLPMPADQPYRYLTRLPKRRTGITLAYKGLPIVSNVCVVLQEHFAALRDRVIEIPAGATHRRFEGWVVRVDLENSGRFAQQLAQIPSSYLTSSRDNVDKHELFNYHSLIESLVDAGVQHYVTTGDGFIAGLPHNGRDVLARVISLLRAIQKYIAFIGGQELIGFRCAIVSGSYLWGRINFLADYSTLLGPDLTRVTRLEQALRDLRRQNATSQHVVTDVETFRAHEPAMREHFTFDDHTVAATAKESVVQCVFMDMKP